MMFRLLMFTFVTAVMDASPEHCDASVDASCLAPQADEMSLGLNALPARIAVVSGQLPNPPICGSWCQRESDQTSPCYIDKDVIPCQTDFYCTTTCALWSLMASERPTQSCAMFTRFDGFPKNAKPCDEACLLPEIRKERYPAPTGLGLLCEPGTCYPASSSMSHLPGVPAVLECPCNWFGSDCPNDLVPIDAVNHTATYGTIMATTLTISSDNWDKVIANHQPGGVIRIVHRDPTNPENGRMREQPYALAYAPSAGKLEILTAPPDMTLHQMPREVAERVRSLPSGPIVGGNLFVNPSIGGFFNKEWKFLMDAIQGSEEGINRLVVLSTGAGLSGALSAVEAGLSIGLQGIHLFHGLQHAQDLPYRKRIDELASSGMLDFAIIESRDLVDSNYSNAQEAGIAAAVQRGIVIRKLSPVTNLDPFLPQKVYVQHAVGLDLTSSGGVLQEKGAALQNTAFVACGRMALLEESFDILKALFCDQNDQECNDMLGRRFFTNI